MILCFRTRSIWLMLDLFGQNRIPKEWKWNLLFKERFESFDYNYNFYLVNCYKLQWLPRSNSRNEIGIQRGRQGSLGRGRFWIVCGKSFDYQNYQTSHSLYNLFLKDYLMIKESHSGNYIDWFYFWVTKWAPEWKSFLVEVYD